MVIGRPVIAAAILPLSLLGSGYGATPRTLVATVGRVGDTGTLVALCKEE